LFRLSSSSAANQMKKSSYSGLPAEIQRTSGSWRRLVDDGVEHQLVASFQRFDIVHEPATVNRFKVDNRKASIDEEGKKGRIGGIDVPLR